MRLIISTTLPQAGCIPSCSRPAQACSPSAGRRHATIVRSAAGSSSPAKFIVEATDSSGKEGPSIISAECESGEIMRTALVANKVDLYTTWNKIWSCGGAGQCGTCIVEVTEGAELLSNRNGTEQKKLAKKPESYRLACQTNVGDGTNSGKVCIKVKPA